jgi:hypothetical protein
MTRRILRITAIVLGLLSLAVFVWPDVTNQRTDEERHTVIDVGLPSSPWLHLEDHKIERRLSNGSFQSGFSRSWNIQFISWSFLLPVLALLLLLTARQVRQPVHTDSVSPRARSL